MALDPPPSPPPSSSPRSFVESVRKRPGLFVGDTLEYGLHHLVYFLLDEAYQEARRGECGEVSLALGADGGIVLFDSAPIVRPEALVLDVTEEHFRRRARDVADESLRWNEWRVVHLTVVRALSSRFQIDLWEHGRQWRLRGARGMPSGEVEEVLPAEAVPEGTARGTRVSFLPDDSIFEVLDFNPEWLERRCRELAMLVPGLRARFSSVGGGEFVMVYPRGIEQRVEELTAGAQRLHAKPLVFDVRDKQLRVRCALQWCTSGGELVSFANTVRTRGHGVHVEGFFLALRDAVAGSSGRQARKLRRNHLARGLTAIITVEGSDREMAFQGPTKSVLGIPGLREAVARQLAPSLEQALRAHPSVTRRIAFQRAPDG